MSPVFWKNLHLCFPTRPIKSESGPPPEQVDGHPSPPPLQAPVVKQLNNSLCDVSFSTSTSKSLMTPSTATTDADVFSSSSDSDAESPPRQPDFASLFASERFFFSSPGRSNSITESREDARRDSVETVIPPLDGGVAVKKYSPDPYSDFRISMQEMIEARKVRDVKSEWEFLHELLHCYLALNPRNTHKFIISAFADILVCLLLTSSPTDSENHSRKQEG